MIAPAFARRIGTAIRSWGRVPFADRPLSRRERLALLAGFVALVLLRLRGAWLHGRLLGEEGTIFFAYAWHRPAAEALWRSFAGYLNIGANATTLLAARLVRAGVLPLEGVPWLTMTMALAVQTIPAAQLTMPATAWLRRRGALAAALLVVATAPLTEEVFTNVLHIQFQLALAAALILACAPPRTPVGAIAAGSVLLVGPLCGPGAIVLLPFFALRAIVDRDRARAGQAAVLGAGTALQLALFFTPNPARGHLPGLVATAAIGFVRLVALPFAGPWLGQLIGRIVYHSYLASGILLLAAAAGMVLYAAAITAVALRRRDDPAFWLIASGLAIAIVSFGGGMVATESSAWFNPRGAERYSFLPLVLVTLGLIVIRERAGASRRLWSWLIGLTLGWGAVALPFPVSAVSRGAPWLAEVAAWRRDHDHPLTAWPASWTVDLSDRDRACPPPDRPSRTAATYCEAAWLQQVADDAARIRAQKDR